MRTREDMDAEREYVVAKAGIYSGEIATRITQLVVAERAFVDHAAQARAIRFAADSAFPYAKLLYADGQCAKAAHWIALQRWAERIERGELVVPEEP